MVHPTELPTEELLGSCRLSRHRRSGPGGQHRNKVETAVQIVHLPTGIRAEANERRSQADNRRVAVFRLRVNLALQFRVAKEIAFFPSKLWNSRCRNGLLAVNPSHDAFPTLLAEAIDALSVVDHQVGIAASQLGCTSSQLVKFLKLEPRALKIVNKHRQEKGLSTYK